MANAPPRTKVEVNLLGGDSELSVASKNDSTTEPLSTSRQANSENPQAVPSESESKSESDGPLCPKCSSPMVRRKAKAGAYAGREFWGCVDFPECRGIIPLGARQGAPADARTSQG